uniref:Protein-tyrosine-phosphatase n=1 Tax=Caenorhabditis japonica TaxID=281687 RepID=A0A8R1HTY8_CAEJA
MTVPEIIIACLAVSMLLMCCVTCFILYVYHKTSSRMRRASRGKTPAQVQQLPHKPPETIVAKTTAPEATTTKRPNKLRIDTGKVCPAKSVVAIETDYSAASFLASMAKDSENRRRLLQDEFLGESDPLRWIATQGPIDDGESVGKETISDFWRMLVQYEVACVVMLGQHHENYVQKCGRYWSQKLGKTEKYGNVEVKVVCELEEKGWVHREFEVSSTSSSGLRNDKIAHWQYKEWKDNDAPAISSFLEFVLQVRTRRYTSPVVVHCSAGIGRTGVFICTDNVISRFESEGIIDIFSEVNRSRQQRPSMVYTLAQYECIYDAIGEYLRQTKK